MSVVVWLEVERGRVEELSSRLSSPLELELP